MVAAPATAYQDQVSEIDEGPATAQSANRHDKTAIKWRPTVGG
jgi:hypothetical protein